MGVEDADDGPGSESSELWSPELLTSKRCSSTADLMVLSKILVKNKHQVNEAIKVIHDCL